MKQSWNEQELVECWTLTSSEQQLLTQRTDRARLGYAVMLKFFQIEGRFPLYNKEVPWVAVDFVADQLKSPAAEWLDFSLKGRTSERVRAAIREFLGYRIATNADSEQLQYWLMQNIVPHQQDIRHIRNAALDWCRQQKLEPPSAERLERIVKSAVRTFENDFFTTTSEKLSAATQQQLDQLLVDSELDKNLLSPEQESDWSVFSKLKSDPGRIGLNSVLKELAKLKRIDNVQLPEDLFSEVSIKTLERYRLRVSTESVAELQRHPDHIRYTLLSAFCWQRRKAIIDSLIELMIQVIHRISIRAEKKVVTEIMGDFEKL